MKKKIVVKIELEGKEKVDMPDVLYKILREYVKVISPLIGKLSNRQQELLTALLYLDNKYKEEIPNDKLRWEVIMSKEGKDQVKGLANLDYANYHNLISHLRKISIFVDNKVIDAIRVFPTNETLSLEFEFKKANSN